MDIFMTIHAWHALKTQLECCTWQVRVAKEELDAVSDLRYSWKKLCKCASEASDHLASLQVCALHRCCCRGITDTPKASW